MISPQNTARCAGEGRALTRVLFTSRARTTSPSSMWPRHPESSSTPSRTAAGLSTRNHMSSGCGESGWEMTVRCRSTEQQPVNVGWRRHRRCRHHYRRWSRGRGAANHPQAVPSTNVCATTCLGLFLDCRRLPVMSNPKETQKRPRKTTLSSHPPKPPLRQVNGTAAPRKCGKWHSPSRATDGA